MRRYAWVMSDDPRYFEDVVVGERCVSASELVTREGIIAFASSFDPQAMHTDEAAAKDSPFGELVASGWHTLSLTMRLMVEAKPFGSTPLIGMAVDEVRLARPVVAGMTLHAEGEVVEKRESKRGDRGYVQVVVQTLENDDLEVARQTWTVVIPMSTIEHQWRV